MTLTEKIKSAKADTMVKVNNVIYGKISDAENSGWRSAFGTVYANSFINKCRQATTLEFLNYEEPEKPVSKRKKRLLDEVESVSVEDISTECVNGEEAD